MERALKPSARAAQLSAALAFTAALAAGLAAAPPAAAQGGVAVGGRVGTTGLGAEVAFPLGARAGARLAGTGGAFDVEVDSERVTYEGEAELASVLAVVDLHPFAGAFRLSLGALVNDNSLTGEAPIRDLLLDEGIEVPPGAELGQLVAEATVEQVAPYAGIGWGSAPSGGGWSLSLDLGAAWHGEPEVDVAVEGPLAGLAGRPEVAPLLAEEERELEEELADYRIFPVVALSVSYRF